MSEAILTEYLAALNSISTDKFRKATIAKKMSKILLDEQSKEEELGEDVFVSTFDSIAKLYFQLDFRDPLKRTFKGLFQDLKMKQFTLDKYLQDSFRFQSNTDIKLGCENIIACLDSFPLGTKAILSSNKEVWPFLLHSLQYVHRKIQSSPSPQEVTELFAVCQSIFKATSLALQEHRRSGFLSTEHLTVLVEIYDTVLDFLLMESTLLNSRLSAGITVANIFKTLFQQDIHLAVHSNRPQPDNFERPVQNIYSEETASFSAQLCAWGGLLACLTPEELTHTQKGDGQCLLIQDILSKILSIHRGKEDPGIILAHARTLFLWTEKASEALRDGHVKADVLPQLTGDSLVGKEIFGYIWSVWDHFMDGVRYHAMAIFQNAVAMHLHSSKEMPAESPFLGSMCEHLLSLPWHQKGKYGALSHLGSCLGTEMLLRSEPLLVDLTVEALKEGGLATHVSELTCVLSRQHLKEVDFELWQKVWLDPLLRGLALGTKQQRCSIQQHILPKLLKIEPRAMQYFVHRLSDRDLVAKDVALVVLIGCLKTAKSA